MRKTSKIALFMEEGVGLTTLRPVGTESRHQQCPKVVIGQDI